LAREQVPSLQNAIRSCGFLGVQLALEREDARETKVVVDQLVPDLLVVDHYSLDTRWETEIRIPSLKVMAIDDLTDRAHDCDVLLDQTLGRRATDHKALVPTECVVLTGSEYALLRPEFSVLRDSGLRNRRALEHVLVNFGGVDSENVTGRILESLRNCALPNRCRITVVMGGGAPHLRWIASRAETMPWPTEVLIDVKDLARVMAGCDLAIGAAGGTAWERCCLGLPALLVLQADNQRAGSAALHAAGAAHLLGAPAEIEHELPRTIDRAVREPGWLAQMSEAAARIVDGKGTSRVLSRLVALYD
jgi:UDP-2,4-diacetamido-2,4,6-trideoxy-beta-L-altropyranose hydrolase